MSEQFDSVYLRGQGPLLLGLRDSTTGKPLGLEFAGDVSAIGITPGIERKKVIENVTGIGGTGASITTGVSLALSITFRSIKPSHLARICQGVATAQAAASITDEAHNGYLGKMIPLAHTKVSSVVVTDSAGTTTYTITTDYLVHADEGLIEIVDGGAITDAEDLLIDYAHAAQNLMQANPGNVDLYAVFAGMNSANSDKQVRGSLYKINLDPGAPDLISDDAVEMTVSGEVLLDTLRPSGDQYYSLQTED